MNFEKIGFPELEYDEVRVCDSCTKEFDYGDRGVMYFCDKIWMQYNKHDLPKVVPQEIYCLSCYPDEIPIPHLGTNEGFCLIEFGEEDENESTYAYNEIGLIAGSSKNKGVDWDPIETLNNHHHISIESIEFFITPMYVYSIFRRTGIDLRGFITDGEFIIPENHSENMKSMIGQSASRSPTETFSPKLL